MSEFTEYKKFSEQYEDKRKKELRNQLRFVFSYVEENLDEIIELSESIAKRIDKGGENEP